MHAGGAVDAATTLTIDDYVPACTRDRGPTSREELLQVFDVVPGGPVVVKRCRAPGGYRTGCNDVAQLVVEGDHVSGQSHAQKPQQGSPICHGPVCRS